MVQGDGIAAQCCAQLLGVAAESSDRAGVPAIMVGARTQRLIGDVLKRDDLFRDLPRIGARIVAWGVEARPRRLPHSAVIVSERGLSERIKSPELAAGLNCKSDWTVCGSRPFPEFTIEKRFGSRVASVLTVNLTKRCEPSACWIESLRSGWLFLLPGSEGKGWLLSVGGDYASLLAESRLVAGQIDSPGQTAGQFPAYPAIAIPFCGPGWLACGSAALAFDPLCGDGAGNAIREAILAAAVIRAAEGGAPAEELREHYRIRLIAGLLRHLQLCREFYATGHRGPWWDAELEFIREGVKYCRRELEHAPSSRYRLRGFELQRFNSAQTMS